MKPLNLLLLLSFIISSCTSSKKEDKKENAVVEKPSSYQGDYMYNGNYAYPLNQFDSLPLRVKNIGDTIIYWTHFANIPYDSTEYKRILNEHLIDSLAFSGPPAPDFTNRPTIWYVQPDTFCVSNGSLFQIKKGEKKLIFNCDLLNNKNRSYNRENPYQECGYTIYLTGFWLIDGKRYYEVFLTDPCNEHVRERFTFDDEFKIYEFGSTFTKTRHFLLNIPKDTINNICE